MDPALKESMARYYDELATEYDEFYLQGRLPGATIDPTRTTIDKGQFRREVQALIDLVGRYCRGAILDAPCGTGFWLSAYAKNASAVTLIDQSPNMLSEARRKARAQDIEQRCTFRQGDILAGDWAGQSFDTILTGFFLSHVDSEGDRLFFDAVRRSLLPGGSLIALDSSWTKKRQSRYAKEGRQVRRRTDRSEHPIYKRYLSPDDVKGFAKQYDLTTEVLHFDDAFIAFTARLPT
jgi:ubiquinone/menaquinone biosynthesis C-methylase UbiE